MCVCVNGQELLLPPPPAQITFVEYYKRQYGKTLVDESQPMLLSRPRIKALAERDVGKEVCFYYHLLAPPVDLFLFSFSFFILFLSVKIWLVPELCHLTGLTEKMRNDFR